MKSWSIVFCLTVLTIGCVPTDPSPDVTMFDTKPLDACLVVSVDLSGSFEQDFGERAYPLLLKIMDKFFTVSMGEDSKVVLSQMSGHDQVILFEGTPRELRRRFASPDELADFITQHSVPDSSPIYRSLERTFRYTNAMPDVSPSTQTLTVLISDLKDSETERSKRSATGGEMLAELERYRKNGGAIALFYVDIDETARWNRILKEAGFEPGQFVISNDLVENPSLPRFE